MADNSLLLKENNPNLQSFSKDTSMGVLNLKVVRRDGSVTPFKSEKISNAIKKAFLAQPKIRNNKDKDNEFDRHLLVCYPNFFQNPTGELVY